MTRITIPLLAMLVFFGCSSTDDDDDGDTTPSSPPSSPTPMVTATPTDTPVPTDTPMPTEPPESPTAANTTPPDTGTTPPDTGTTPPDTGTTPPDVSTTPPDITPTLPAGSGTPAVDADHDGSPASEDCDDSNPDAYPGAPEVCDAGGATPIDNDCDGLADDEDDDVTGTSSWYPDADNDGYGDEDAPSEDACEAPDGSVDNADDCDDARPDAYPGAAETCNSKDDDCDDQVDENVVNKTWYKDNDGDGYGSSADTVSACAQPAGYVAQSGDCADSDASIHPGATETCNSKDDDCDSQTDEGLSTTWYKDNDGDGYGATASGTTQACAQPSGYVANNTDCDDTARTTYPGAVEQCNGKDDDCDGTIDDNVASTTWYKDSDGDGYGSSASGTKSDCAQPTGYVSNNTDCNDADKNINPGATETCNSKDDDCDSQVDEGVKTTFYKDNDGDGYGSSASGTTQACTAPTGYTTTSTDCNDTDATIKPGATETCDGKDNDCDATIDEGVTSTFYRDADGDGYGTSATTTQACSAPSGYVSNSTDCNDADASIKPGATEACNGKDDDCDGSIDEGAPGTTWYKDNDGDGYGASSSGTTSACAQPSGYVSNNTDCNDADASIKPGATEACNSKDDDCDGSIDEGAPGVTWYKDNDGDGDGSSSSTTSSCAQPSGYVSKGTDCDDTDGDVYGSAPEMCDLKDNDCNGKRDDKLYSGTFPTGYAGICGAHTMLPVEGQMAAPTGVALVPTIDFDAYYNGTSYSTAFLSSTSGSDGHLGNIKGAITGTDGSSITLGTCTTVASSSGVVTRVKCGSIPAGSFKKGVTYTFDWTHTQKADGTGWKIRGKGKFSTQMPCDASFNTKTGFKFTKFGSTSSVVLNLMNTGATQNPIQLGATLVGVPKTGTFPVSSFKLALGPLAEAAGSTSYTYGFGGATAVAPGASLSATGVLTLPQGNIAVPSPATSTTVSTMYVYEAVMTGTLGASGNITTWSNYGLSGIVTKLDMMKFFDDAGSSVGVGYDIANYTPSGGTPQGPAANASMTATPTSITITASACQ